MKRGWVITTKDYIPVLTSDAYTTKQMSRLLRVLIACEFSGVVRSAFERRGWEAWSCDFLPTEIPSVFHHQGDVRGIIGHKWDLLIGHPPCTFLANSSAKHLYNGMKKEGGKNQERWNSMVAGAMFFKYLLNQNHIPHIAIENPIMLGYAQEIVGCGPTQTIQPYEYGHGETKATCLWLKGLSPLTPTNVVEGRTPRVHFASPGPDRWKERSRTLPGIAEAMAATWGGYIENQREVYHSNRSLRMAASPHIQV